MKSSLIEYHLLLEWIKNWHIEIKRIKSFVSRRLKLIQSQRLVSRRFVPTIPRPVFNDEVVLGHPSRGIVGDIEEKSSSLSLSTFESSLGSETNGRLSFVSRFDQSQSITVTEFARKTRGWRTEMEIPPCVRDTDSHWSLVLARVSGRSQTHWTRKRVLIVREKRNPGGQNVRRETASRQTPMVVTDNRARCPWSRWIQRRFIWFKKRTNDIDQQAKSPQKYPSCGFIELKWRIRYLYSNFYTLCNAIMKLISHANIWNIIQICKFIRHNRIMYLCNYVFIIKIMLSHCQHSDDSNLIQTLPE